MKFLLFFLAALSFAKGPASLRIQLAAEPSTLDPLQVSDVLGFNLASNVVEGLMRLDGKGKLRKGLAASYKISKSGLVYRFRLKKEAKWSDGKPVRAEDFVLGLRHALDPHTAARDAALLGSIKAVREEKGELVIELKREDASLLQALTMPLAGPWRKDFLEENKGEWRPHQPSTGPYRIARYKPDREIRLEPNPFHGNARLALDFKVIPEETTALNLFETGGLELLTTVPSTEIPRLRKAGLVGESPSAAAFYLSFNLSKPPFQDARWRKALAAGVNRESLARILPGLKPAFSYLPDALAGSAPLSLSYPEEAAWAKGRKKPNASLVFPSSALGNLLMQRLQNDLGKLGWEMKLEPLEWKAYLGRLAGDAPSVFYMGYSAPFNDPMSHLKLFLSGNPDNRSHYSSPEYDRAVEKVRKARGRARAKAAKEAQRILVEKDAVVIPLLERRQLMGVAKGVRGFAVNPYGVMSLETLRREGK